MDFRINIEDGTGPGQMTFEKADNIINNVYLSLMVRRGAFFQNPSFGSRLYLLKKNTENAASLAKDYCEEALRWLLDTGKATAIDVTVERDRIRYPHRLGILVEVTQADGRQVTFETFMEVV